MVSARPLTALLLLGATPAVAQQAAPILSPGEALVQVSATGEVKAVPDRATITASVSADAATAKAALAANAAKAQRLLAALRDQGVGVAAIRTSDLSVRPRYRPDKDGDDTDSVIGFRAVNRVSVAVAAADAGRIVDALGDGGATEVGGPDFSFADERDLRTRARALAVEDAQRRGRDYAAAFGMKRLRVTRVSERRAEVDGASDIVVTGSRIASPTVPGERIVSVTVWVDYAISP